MNKINLSIAPKDEIEFFKSVDISTDKFENKAKSFNYSLINWKTDEKKKENEYNRKRLGEKFESSCGLIVDIDEGLSISEAMAKLKEERLNYIIITSRNHQKDTKKEGKFSPAQDRYHIILFFNREVDDPEVYRSAYNQIETLFPGLDPRCKDLARFMYASPQDAEYYSWFEGENINIDNVTIEKYDFLNMPIAEKKDVFEFDIEGQVRLGSGKVVKIKDITTKQPCHCLRPEHPDKNPSAFIKYDPEKDKWMSYCSGCGYVGWSRLTKKEYELNKQMQHFYYLGKDVYEMGIAEEKFFLTKNSEKNFCYTIGADSKKKREAALKNLIKSRRLRTLTRVDYVGNPYISESYYSVSPEDGLVNVNIAAVQPIVKDNQFIEDYLERTFGSNRDFIKQYLAMYVYTNHTNLPTLILYGPRGCGKTTFAGLVADIYPSLYHDWSGETSNFSQECEKKLLVIEENLIDEKSQYKTLKKYTGQKFLLVNKKYQPEYMVKNNLNILLISNEQIPLYVEKTEKPNNPNNNQFFVWEFPAISKKIDGTFNQKLKERLGHYIRTELKTVFDNINKSYTRYGIPVPITTYEEQLFENNTTNIEAQADIVLEKIENRYKTFTPSTLYTNEEDDELREAYDLYAKRYLPYALVEKFSRGGVNPNAVIKNLKKRKVIEQKVDRKTENKRKFNCYKIIKLP